MACVTPLLFNLTSAAYIKPSYYVLVLGLNAIGGMVLMTVITTIYVTMVKHNLVFICI